jgi:exosome complex RNA-binding protein Csl4
MSHLFLDLYEAKSHCIRIGQYPMMKYHRQLMNAVLYDKIKIADAVNAEVISLQDTQALTKVPPRSP